MGKLLYKFTIWLCKRTGLYQFMVMPASFKSQPSEFLAVMENFMPLWENNMDEVLDVCICGGCEKVKPRIEGLAKDFRLSLFYKDSDGKN